MPFHFSCSTSLEDNHDGRPILPTSEKTHRFKTMVFLWDQHGLHLHFMFQLKFTIVYNSLSVFAFFCLHDCSVAIMLPLSYHAESTWTCTIICDCTDCTVFVKKQSRCSGIFNNPETSPKHTYDTHTHAHSFLALASTFVSDSLPSPGNKGHSCWWRAVHALWQCRVNLSMQCCSSFWWWQ